MSEYRSEAEMARSNRHSDVSALLPPEGVQK
jgi:hypothetical protein